MKKVLLMLFAIVLCVPFIGAEKKASANAGGILDGKILNIGNFTQGTVVSTTTLITDSDLGSYASLGFQNTTAPCESCHAWIDLKGEYNITGYIKKIGRTSTLNFYDKNKVALQAVPLGTPSDNTVYNITRSNVRYVMVGNSVTNYENAVYNLDVFGSLIPGTEVLDSPSLTASAGNASVSLTWTSVSGATSYNVKRSTSEGGPYTTIATGISGTTYNDSGLTNGTKYYYVVTAVNAGGENSNSNEANATPTAPVSSGRALLTIHLVGGAEKEYDLSSAELDSFLDWTDSATQSSRYKFVKTWNKGPFKARAEYIVYGKIVNFDVDEYEPAQ